MLINILTVVGCIIIYFLFRIFYFSKEEKKIKKALSLIKEPDKKTIVPKVLNDLPVEENVFDDEFLKEEEFNISEYEIKDPYRKKSISDLDKFFNENLKDKQKDIDDEIEDLLL